LLRLRRRRGRTPPRPRCSRRRASRSRAICGSPSASATSWCSRSRSMRWSRCCSRCRFRRSCRACARWPQGCSGRGRCWPRSSRSSSSFATTAAHWLLTGLPLALMAPLAGLSLGVPAAALPGIVVSVAVGSIALSLIGSIGAALTLGVKRSSALLALLTLPLSLPVLIFGARATQLAISGGPLLAPIELLAALAVLGVTLAPLAAAAAVRISLEEGYGGH